MALHAENFAIVQKANEAALRDPVAVSLLKETKILALLEKERQALGLTEWKSNWQVYIFLVYLVLCKHHE